MVCQVVQVVFGVEIIGSFRESVDEYSIIRTLNLDIGIRTVIVMNWNKDIATWNRGSNIVRSIMLPKHIQFGMAPNDMIADYRVDFDPPQKSTSRLQYTEEENGCGYGYCTIDAVFDQREDCDDNSNKEYYDLQR